MDVSDGGIEEKPEILRKQLDGSHMGQGWGCGGGLL